MNNFLLWIGGLVTVCLGLLFAGPHFVDWNSYRGVIEEEASRYFGRRVRVGGEVNLRVLPVPYVSFDKLSIADTATASGGTIIRTENFKMWLSVPPLLQGILEAHHIELRRPVIDLVIDDKGGGNWQNLTINAQTMSYLPGGFSLEALDMIDGQVVLRNATGGELTRAEAVNGTLSASAIEGPYKFSGSFKWQEETRSLRLATARPNANGDVRVKASMSIPGVRRSNRSVVLDGLVSSVSGKTAFSGNVTAKMSGSGSPKQVAQDPAPAKTKPAVMSTFDLKSQLVVDTGSLKLTAINLALETDGPPQLMTGNASLTWANKVALDVELNSRWIDFDRFTVSSATAAPLDNARQLLVALGRALPQEADTNVRIAFDQATLGGEALGAIQLAAVRASGPLTLKEFEASVPGGGKLAISGELSVSRQAPGFRGRLSAEGQSLLKFLRWGLRNEALAEGLADGPFAVDGQLSLAENSFALSNVTIDFGDTPLKGDLSMQLGSSRAVSVNLEGHTIDWKRLSAKPFNAGIARMLVAVSNVEEKSGEGGNKPAPDGAVDNVNAGTFADLAANSDVQLSFKAANLVDGDETYRDFEGKMIVSSGALSVPVLRFSRDSGLEVDIGGEAGPVAGSQAKTARASVKGLVAASSRLAIADLLQFLEASDLDPILRKRLTALAPLRVASVIQFGNKAQPSTDMRFDGMSRGGRLVANLHFANGLPSWRTSPATLNATIDNQSANRLFSLVSDSRTFARADLDATRQGRLYVKAVGTPSKGLLTRAVIESDGLDLNYYGDVVLAEGEPFAFDGRVDFDAASMQAALALMGVELGAGVGELPIKGGFKVVRKDTTLRLNAQDVAIHGSMVNGFVSLTEQSNAPSKLFAKLKVDHATMPGVMRAVLAPRKINASERPASPGGDIEASYIQKAAITTSPDPAVPVQSSSIWPKQQFDLTPLTNVEGYLTATFDTFAFASDGGLVLSDARLEASVAPGRLSVTKLAGGALDGETEIVFDINKAAAGVDLAGTLDMRIGKAQKNQAREAQPDSEVAPGDVAPKYAAVFNLNYKGRAFAPQGLAADLNGAGKLVLADATLTGLTATEVRQAVDEAMKAEGPVNSETFVASLKDKLKRGQIELGSLEIPVALKDGAVTMAEIEIDGGDGQTTFGSSLDVATMKFDSAWKIAARDPAASDDTSQKARLPAVTATYVGELSALATVEPQLSTGALEREIAVRKMERDVAELERLRKLDEARAKEEEERRRALEARLAEQRRLQAERERQLLLEQQQGPQVGPDGLVTPPDGDLVDPNLQDPNAAAAIEGAEAPEPTPRRRKRKRPPKKDVWNPFQITPY